MKCLLTVLVFVVVYAAICAIGGLLFDGGWEAIRWIWLGIFNVSLPSVDYPYFVLLFLILSLFTGSTGQGSK